MREQGHVPEQRLLEVRSLPAGAMVADRLQIAEGESVVVRRRLFLVDQQANRPVWVLDHGHRTPRYPGWAGQRRFLDKRRPVVTVATRDRRQAHRSVDELSATMPSPAEVEQLGLSVGLPVVRILRTIYDDTGMPLELQETVAAADRHEFATRWTSGEFAVCRHPDRVCLR